VETNIIVLQGVESSVVRCLQCSFLGVHDLIAQKPTVASACIGSTPANAHQHSLIVLCTWLEVSSVLLHVEVVLPVLKRPENIVAPCASRNSLI
jgi:hypothetical protein